jgi:hypothetical protein
MRGPIGCAVFASSVQAVRRQSCFHPRPPYAIVSTIQLTINGASVSDCGKGRSWRGLRLLQRKMPGVRAVASKSTGAEEIQEKHVSLLLSFTWAPFSRGALLPVSDVG